MPSSQVVQRIAREIRRLASSPPAGITYTPTDEEQLHEVRVTITGPENTPYEGGAFVVKLVLSSNYPNEAPRGYFLTKIFHPNVAVSNGSICVNTLAKDWSPDVGLAHVLQVIRCLLIVPFPESALNDEAARLFLDSYEEYDRRAKLWTEIHASKGVEKSVSCTGGSSPNSNQSSPLGKENKMDTTSGHSVEPETPKKRRTETPEVAKRKAQKKKSLRRL